MPNDPAAPSPQPSLEMLRAQVQDAGLCVACGACVGLCPHLIFLDGRVAAPDACGLVGGRCHDLCPQTVAPGGQPAKRRALHAARGQDADGPLGPLLAAFAGRAADESTRRTAQYGGVVSALLGLALDEGVVGEAVVTKADQRGAPQGVRVRQRDQVLAAAGSRYAAGAGLSALNQALAEAASHPLAVVALPCQALAAASMSAHPGYPQAASRLKLVIGLFCTLNLSARGLRALLEQAGVAQPVLRADFPPPPAGVFQVTNAAGMAEIPLEQVHQAVLKGCGLCPDLTAELADVAVGAVEGRPGWNTVLARTPAGLELVELARARGVLELEQLTEADLAPLAGAARAKRARGLAAWKERDNA